ncbi:MAG: ATP-binding protein [Bacteroidetes bacterium]|nr:ATP-binding protein [Bacteroidota bacterium]
MPLLCVVIEFKRQVFSKLGVWLKSPRRKPLILRGARQVGKTTLVKDFAKTFEQSILLILEKKEHYNFFEQYEDARQLVDALFLSFELNTGKKEETLLFIDEIQESPKAIKLLRYLYEELPELPVIAAGSLLEFALKDVQSFPVGRVEFMYLHPMNFAEYLEAMGYEMALEKYHEFPLKPLAHSVLQKYFHEYAIVGGMPEVVSNYSTEKQLSQLPKVYESIWATYGDDVKKYAVNDTERRVISHIMNTAHLYLDQRITFQHFGNSNYKSREVGEAFRKLDDAKVLRLIYPTTETTLPLKPNLRKSPRMQFLDTGLVNYSLRIQAELLALNDLSHAFKGSLIPHLVTQEIISTNVYNDPKPMFWVREKKQAQSELDILQVVDNTLIPVEIKSGSAGKLRSLHVFLEMANLHFAIRIYGGELSLEQHKTASGWPYTLLNLPYYLGAKIDDYARHFYRLVNDN